MQHTTSDWVASQRKTLLRWVNSKLPAVLKVNDLSDDLRNGLRLAELVNQISGARKDTSTFLLVPVHRNPTFKLQMVENVQDVLDYCRLILKINLTGISADSIVDGNEKLVLGLVWLLFVNSSALTISQLSNHGFAELKGIITDWVRTIAAKKNIVISDLNKDWSLSRDCRPDLIFFEILEHYCPGKLSLGEKPVQNLATIITFAETYLGIAKLVDVETFIDLIPDEKCILTYLVEWYMVMETKLSVQNSHTNEFEDNLLLEPMLQLMVQTIRLRNTYETKALRFINKVNSLVPKITGNLEYLNQSCSPSSTMGTTLSYLQQHIHNSELAKVLNIFATTEASLNDFMCVAEGYELYLNSTLSLLLTDDYPELQTLVEQINNNLQLCGLQYIPPKFYTPAYLEQKCNQLSAQGNALHLKVCDVINDLQEQLRSSVLSLLFLEIEEACSKKNIEPDSREHYIMALLFVEHITQVSSKLNQISKTVHFKCQIFNIAAVNKMQTIDNSPQKVDDITKSVYELFREKLLQGNQFTEQELFNLLQGSCHETLDANLLKQLLRLIPSKSLEKDIDSDFQLSDGSDHDSDEGHSTMSLFDGIQKKIETKLFGSEKVYDTEEFLAKVDNGFRV